MGIDFLQKTAKHFKRHCQTGFESLTAANLYDPAVAPTRRSFLANLTTESQLAVGDDVVLRAEGDQIALFKQERQVGATTQPPEEILSTIRGRGNCLAVGRVEAVHKLANAIDVTVQ